MESISALMDGELDDREAGRELEPAEGRPRAPGALACFPSRRGCAPGEEPLSPDLTQLAQRSPQNRPFSRLTVFAQTRRFTTYALSAAASLAAVAFVGWMALTPTVPVGPVARVVVPPIPAPALVDVPQVATVSSEGRMNEYLLAHQGFSPSTAIQGLAPYIRSVSTTRTVDSR